MTGSATSMSDLNLFWGTEVFSNAEIVREVYLLAVADPHTAAKYPAEYLTDSDDKRVTEIQFPIEKV